MSAREEIAMALLCVIGAMMIAAAHGGYFQ